MLFFFLGCINNSNKDTNGNKDQVTIQKTSYERLDSLIIYQPHH